MVEIIDQQIYINLRGFQMLLRKILLTGAIVSFTMAGIDFARAETVQDHYKNIKIGRAHV